MENKPIQKEINFNFQIRNIKILFPLPHQVQNKFYNSAYSTNLKDLLIMLKNIRGGKGV